jgi:hypothetical protein
VSSIRHNRGAATNREESLQMALAKSMVAKSDESDMQRPWSKMKSEKNQKSRRECSGLADMSDHTKPSLLDKLPIEAEFALTASSIVSRSQWLPSKQRTWQSRRTLR